MSVVPVRLSGVAGVGGGAMRAYLQMALDLSDMCTTETEDMTVTQTAGNMAPIEKGADVHAKTRDGWIPLHQACVNGNAEVVKPLLEKGADVRANNNTGWMPLHWTYERGHAEVVKALLEKGADVHANASDGYTPLYEACTSCHAEVVKALHANGAVE